MRERAKELVSSIPNIKIRPRVEVEAEGFDSDHLEYADSASNGTEDYSQVCSFVASSHHRARPGMQ